MRSSVPRGAVSNAALSALLVAGLALAVSSEVASVPDAGVDVNAVDLVVYAVVTLLLVVNVWRRAPAEATDGRVVSWLTCVVSYVYFLGFEAGSAFQWVVALHVLGDSSLVYLGRSFSLLPARRQIRSGWLYRWVRHPAYASYILTDVSYCVAVPSVRNVLVGALGATLLIYRAELEERVLRGDDAYQRYQRATRWRFLPGVY